MAYEQPSTEALDKFDEAVDDATHAVLDHFGWLGLPEGDQLSALMVQINDSLTAIMREWL